MQNSSENAGNKETLAWDDVRYFLELARQGKLTAAARVLGVEHSTVSRRVGALENKVGIRLFDRLAKSWNLTAEGEALLAHAYRIEEQALAFSRASMGIGAVQGVVRVSAPPVFASHFLAPRLAALAQRWPGVTLELIGESRQANLYRREADLALRLSRPQEPGLAGRPLAGMGYSLYATQKWRNRPAAEWEFVGYDYALREAPQQKWLYDLAAGRRFTFVSNDAAALHQACRSGLGVAVLPHFLADEDPVLSRLPGYDRVLSRDVWMVIHPDVRRSPRVKAVAEFITRLCREHESVLA